MLLGSQFDFILIYVIMFTNTYMGRGFEAAPKALPVSRERFIGQCYAAHPSYPLTEAFPLAALIAQFN